VNDIHQDLDLFTPSVLDQTKHFEEILSDDSEDEHDLIEKLSKNIEEIKSSKSIDEN